MDNQHRHIKGYRELNEDEIGVINAIKDTAAVVGELVDSLKLLPLGADERWLDIAKTNLQQGFMALTRAVAKPEFF